MSQIRNPVPTDFKSVYLFGATPIFTAYKVLILTMQALFTSNIQIIAEKAIIISSIIETP